MKKKKSFPMIEALKQFLVVLRCQCYILVLSKHLFVTQKPCLKGSTSFGFAQNTLHQNTQSPIAELSFVTLTIHLCYGPNLVTPRKTCFLSL